MTDTDHESLPEGWVKGYGRNAHDTAMVGHVYTKERNGSNWMVRFDYRVDGYRAFTLVGRDNVKGFQPVGQPSTFWTPVPGCPAFDAPIACALWLEVEHAS